MASQSAVSVTIAQDKGFSAGDAAKLVEAFTAVDADGSGFVEQEEVVALFKELGKTITIEEADGLIRAVDENSDGKVSFSEFCDMYTNAESAGGLKSAVTSRHGALNVIQGTQGIHSYAEEEKVAFTEHINNCLGMDEYLASAGVLPVDPNSESLFSMMSDGIVMAKLINKAVPETIDERTLNYPKAGKTLNPWEKKENQNLVINSAKAIGCNIINVHASDLIDTLKNSKQYLVLGVVWQMVKIQLLNSINLRSRPELVKLLQEDEELADFMALPPEDILLRWINYHMEKQGCDRRARNFGSDLKDSVIYANLINSITPAIAECDKDQILRQEGRDRAAAVITGARAQGVESFIQPTDIISGNKRLNLAFCAQIFNNNPGLIDDEEELQRLIDAAGLLDDDEADSREERTFRMWMNSLNLGDPAGSVYINNLIFELWDGMYILETEDKVQPGIVNWKKVTKPKEGKKLNKFNAVANCNYAVDIGKEMGLSLVGIGGVDIHDRNRKLILALVWQLMRRQVLNLLKEVGGGVAPKDQDIIDWANARVRESGRENQISSFKDPSIANGLFLLDLLHAIEPRMINPELVTAGSDEDEQKNNARYIISVARKLGAQIFCTYEDIMEVKSKMIFTLVASIQYAAQMWERAGK
jgi:plastin-1